MSPNSTNESTFATDTATIRQVLQGTPFYSAWPNELIDALCRIGQPVAFATGQSRTFNSSTEPGVYLIESGVMEMVVVLANGREQAIGYLHAGAFLGLHQSLAYFPHEEMHDYIADREVVAWRFAPEKFRALMREFQPLSETVTAVLATRLGFMVDAAATNALLSAEARVAKCLLKSCRDAEFKVLWAKSSSDEFNLTQAQLARMLGLSRQSVGTTLRLFELRGLITLGRQKIDVLNAIGLREVVNGAVPSSAK